MADLNTLGPRAAVDLLQSYAGVDFSRVLNFQNRNGLTGQTILQQAFAAIGGVNEALVSRYANMLYVTTSDTVMYRQGEGQRLKTPKKTEFAVGDGVRGAQTGHMLPLTDYEDLLQWGPMWLRDARQVDVDTDLQLVVEKWQNRVEDDLWERVFANTEQPQGAGYSVGWAIGSGVNVPYVPPPYGGTTFTGSHTHYLYQAGTSSANVFTLVDNMVKEMRHHGHGGNLLAFVSGADVDVYAGMTKFVALQPSGFTIIPGSGAASVQVASGTPTGMPGELFGYLNTTRGIVELRYYERIPSGYLFITKSYGANNPNNGLAIRLHPDVPFGLTPLLMLTRTITPEMELIQLRATHGVGINKRLNGAVGYFATSASAYVNPTF